MFEACECLKLLSIYFDLCVDATGIVCHQLGLLGSDLHTVGSVGFVETLLIFCKSGSVSCDDCDRMFPEKLRVSSFPARLPYYA